MRRVTLHLNRRFSFGLKLIVLILLTPAHANELSLRPFKASYDIYESGMHVAVSELRLQRNGDDWRYRSLTRARGIFAWFTKKQPLAETTFSVSESNLRLREIVIGDAGTEKTSEAARFDWSEGKAEVMRKGKRKQLALDGDVYDYQSIHVLAASMGRQRRDQATVNFYRKGRLRKSYVVHRGERRISVNGKGMAAIAYEQVIDKSSTKMIYYYDADNPQLLLRVEKFKSGKSPTVMTLSKIEWDL